jgi:intraflagellar transport protein 122
MTSKNYKKAIDIYTKENYFEGLIEVCRILERDGNEQILASCAQLFKKNKEHSYAKEVHLKMGDMKSLMLLHIELEKW